MKMRNTYFIAIYLLIFCAAITGCGNNVEVVHTDNYMNKNLEFYYYIPARILEDTTKKHPVLVCIPGLGGDGTVFKNSAFQDFAEKEGFILICPSFRFDEDNWDKNTSYQYPAAWSGKALINMVKLVESKHHLRAGKYYLHGFSAGAQYALRFAIWNPSLCAATVGHGSGSSIQPKDTIPVKFYISVGKKDTERIDVAQDNYSRLREEGIDARYRVFEGGHMLPASQIQDSLKFFKDTRARLGD